MSQKYFGMRSFKKIIDERGDFVDEWVDEWVEESF